MKKFDILWELPKCDPETWSGQMLLEKLCQLTCSMQGYQNLQFIKVQYLWRAVKHNKVRYDCTVESDLLSKHGIYCSYGTISVV